MDRSNKQGGLRGSEGVPEGSPVVDVINSSTTRLDSFSTNTTRLVLDIGVFDPSQNISLLSFVSRFRLLFSESDDFLDFNPTELRWEKGES